MKWYHGLALFPALLSIELSRADTNKYCNFLEEQCSQSETIDTPEISLDNYSEIHSLRDLKDYQMNVKRIVKNLKQGQSVTTKCTNIKDILEECEDVQTLLLIATNNYSTEKNYSSLAMRIENLYETLGKKTECYSCH